jgi:hypothetical protein
MVKDDFDFQLDAHARSAFNFLSDEPMLMV